jgi:hypothetical protein
MSWLPRERRNAPWFWAGPILGRYLDPPDHSSPDQNAARLAS